MTLRTSSQKKAVHAKKKSESQSQCSQSRYVFAGGANALAGWARDDAEAGGRVRAGADAPALTYVAAGLCAPPFAFSTHCALQGTRGGPLHGPRERRYWAVGAWLLCARAWMRLLHAHTDGERGWDRTMAFYVALRCLVAAEAVAIGARYLTNVRGDASSAILERHELLGLLAITYRVSLAVFILEVSNGICVRGRCCGVTARGPGGTSSSSARA